MNLSSRPLLFLACSAGLTVLAGCGSITDVRSFSTPYSSPTTGETARLRVISDGMVRGVPQSSCIDFRLPGAGVMVVARDGFANRNGESLGMPPTSVRKSSTVMSELRVPAGRPMAFHYNGNRCYNSFTFVPEAGADYELEAASSYRCAVTLKRTLPGESKSQYVPLGDSKMCNWGDNL